MGKVSGGDGKSHGGVNRRQGLEGGQWDRNVWGKGIGGAWGVFFTCSYLFCYSFGAPKNISMDEELSECWCPTVMLAAGRAAQVKQIFSSISERWRVFPKQ